MNKMKFNRLKYENKDIKNYDLFSLEIDPNDNNIWYISFKGVKNTLYENENFKLKFQFNDRYVSNNNL